MKLAHLGDFIPVVTFFIQIPPFILPEVTRRNKGKRIFFIPDKNPSYSRITHRQNRLIERYSLCPPFLRNYPPPALPRPRSPVPPVLAQAKKARVARLSCMPPGAKAAASALNSVLPKCWRWIQATSIPGWCFRINAPPAIFVIPIVPILPL